MIFPDAIQNAVKPQRPWLDTGLIVTDSECFRSKSDELKEVVKDLAKKVRTNVLAFKVYDKEGTPEVDDDDDDPNLFGGDDSSDDDDDSCDDGRGDAE